MKDREIYEHDRECSCGHEHSHTHDGECSCGHEHSHTHDGECSCGHEHHHSHAHNSSGDTVQETQSMPPGVTQQVYILDNFGCANCAEKMELKINNLSEVEAA